MRLISRPAGILVLVVLLALPGVAAGADIVKHSGTVADVDRDQATIVLFEVGPWRHDGDVTLMTVRRIHVPPGTPFVLVCRTQDPPSGFRDDFVEELLQPWQVYAGDFVTVDCEHRAGRMIARRIAILDESAP